MYNRCVKNNCKLPDCRCWFCWILNQIRLEEWENEQTASINDNLWPYFYLGINQRFWSRKRSVFPSPANDFALMLVAAVSRPGKLMRKSVLLFSWHSCSRCGTSRMCCTLTSLPPLAPSVSHKCLSLITHLPLSHPAPPNHFFFLRGAFYFGVCEKKENTKHVTWPPNTQSAFFFLLYPPPLCQA